MNKESVKKLLLSSLYEDNMIGMCIIIGQDTILNVENIKWKLFDIVGFEGWYLMANIDTTLTDRALNLILNHPISNTNGTK